MKVILSDPDAQGNLSWTGGHRKDDCGASGRRDLGQGRGGAPCGRSAGGVPRGRRFLGFQPLADERVLRNLHRVRKTRTTDARNCLEPQPCHPRTLCGAVGTRVLHPDDEEVRVDQERPHPQIENQGYEKTLLGQTNFGKALFACSRLACSIFVRRRRAKIGAAGFEPAASCSQSTRATKLRHAPVGGSIEGLRSKV